MSKVNIRLGEAVVTPALVPVQVKSVKIADASVVVGNVGILPATWAGRTDETGLYVIYLRMGRYEITAASAGNAEGQQYRVQIDVPNDALEYEHTALIVSPTVFTPAIGGGTPNATQATAGAVKTATTASSLPAVVYRKEEIDALLAGTLAVGGINVTGGGGITGADASLAGIVDIDVLSVGNGLTVGSGGVAVQKILWATATLDFPSIAAGGQQELTVTVTGAAVGDVVCLGLPAAPAAGIDFTAYVSAANTAKVRAVNPTGSAVDPASGTYRLMVVSF